MGIFYQVQGAAVGSRMAPSYAYIIVHYLEERIQVANLKPTLWLRFVDDIFMMKSRKTSLQRKQILNFIVLTTTLGSSLSDIDLMCHTFM